MSARLNGQRIGRAAVYPAPNKPFEIREMPLREVEEGEALVRVTMCTICRSDIHSYQGHRPNPCPGILGHEIIGVIEELGEKVQVDLRGDPLAVGDRVTWTEYFADGPSVYRDLYDMPQKAAGLRKYGHDLVDDDPHFVGGFADYCFILPGTGILKLPNEITDEEATPLNCGVATVMAVTEAAAIEMGDTVVVQGLGLLGIYGCAIAKARGARTVIAIDQVASRLEMAKRFGADFVVDVGGLDDEGIAAAVAAIVPASGVDAVIELAGTPKVIPSGIQMLRVGGRYVLGGLVNPGSEFTLDGNDIIRKWITLRGIHNYHPRHLVQALDFVMANRGRFPFAEIVSAQYPLEQLGKAFDDASNRQVLRAAIVP